MAAAVLPMIRAGMWLVWPARVFLEGAESLARISEHEVVKTEEQRTEEGIEALVEAAEEEGIIEPEQGDLIEQVVEFSDKRVREVMTRVRTLWPLRRTLRWKSCTRNL